MHESADYYFLFCLHFYFCYCISCIIDALNSECIGEVPIMQLHTWVIKIVNIQAKSPSVETGRLLKERICSHLEQILSFNRSPFYEKGCN